MANNLEKHPLIPEKHLKNFEGRVSFSTVQYSFLAVGGKPCLLNIGSISIIVFTGSFGVLVM